MVLGCSRDQAARDGTELLRDNLLDRGVKMRGVVDWPEQAACWARQATRFTASAPDLWIVIVTNPDNGWMRMRQRLRDTNWDPDRTLAITTRP